MPFSVPHLPHWCTQAASKLVALSGSLLFGAGASVAFSSPRAVAAENIVLTFGLFERTVSVESLRNLVETGETTPTLDFIFDAVRITPDDARSVMTSEVGVSLGFIDDVFYSLPGEYALFQLGQIFYNKSRSAEIQALRSSLTLSVSEDGALTLLEVFENYPNQELYVDGQLLSDVANTVANFIEDTGRSLAVPIAVIKDILDSIVCECGTAQILVPLEGSEFLELSVTPEEL